MNFKIPVLSLLVLLLCAACKGQTTTTEPTSTTVSNPEHFSKTNLLHHIKTLSSDDFEGRRTGTPGGLKAKAYIIEQFKALGVEVLGDSYEQPFSFEGRDKSYDAVNVLGLVKGSAYPDKYIVISAHYDHEGIKKGEIYNGADDDASGISALFSFAEYFKTHPPKHSVILAAFDAEELGLRGARHFVDNPVIDQDQIYMNINMDMISRSDKKELYAVGPNYYEQLKPAIENAKKVEGFHLLMGHDGTDGKDDWTNASDHAAFHKKEIPFIYFGVEDHKDYHKPTDDFENIHPDFYATSVEVIISVFEQLDNVN